MKTNITRRDFLKLAGLLPFSIAFPNVLHSDKTDKQNVIIIVFDALSAHNISLYGYPRQTMPNLVRLAEKAVVYHNHYAGGNFTTPGTASLLTGVLPWRHRAINNNGTVISTFAKKSIFAAFQDYYRITYSHNPWVYTLLKQFAEDLGDLIPLDRFLLLSNDILSSFSHDEDIANVSWFRILEKESEGSTYSLFLSLLYEQYQKYRKRHLSDLLPFYPRGLPSIDYSRYFLLEDFFNWLGNYIAKLPQPFLGYFHLWPPHEPYRTHRDFYGRFASDGWTPIEKPNNPFSYGLAQKDAMRLPKMRMQYDEYILYADEQFGKLFTNLEKLGLLENTWVVLTSDHGESFERGIEGHSTAVLYQPLIHIPLIIFEPGRSKRQDIYTPTSAIDLLPTLLHVTRHQTATWSDGIIIPPFAPAEHTNRSIYAIEARNNDQFAPLTTATVTIIKKGYKLMYSFGYTELKPENERLELFDIENDPEELIDLHNSKREIVAELLNELKMKLKEYSAIQAGA